MSTGANRLDIDFTIHWQTSWHVGSGFASAGVNRLIKRWPGTRLPYVPGSQLKGVLREACERIASAFGLAVVNPHAVDRDTQEALVRSFVPLKESDLVIDRLFGSRYCGDCLFVDNAVPVDPPLHYTIPATRTRTAVDRVTGTVLERRLFSSELADRFLQLRSAIHCRHPAGVLTQHEGGFPYEYMLLVGGLLSIDALGGDKSAGLGRCRIVIDQVRWQGREISLAECLSGLKDEWAEWLQLIRQENKG